MSIKIANAPVSWGIYEFEGITPKFPYTQVLNEIAATGYAGLEYGPWGYLPADADLLLRELKARDLRLLSAFVPVKLTETAAHVAATEHALRVGRVLAALGAEYIVLADDNGTVPELVAHSGRRSGVLLDAAQWRVVGSGVDGIARRMRDELGLKLVFHHHCAGYVETPEETRALLENTDPDLVGLCLDTGHWHYAGGDALACVREFGERVRYLHLKDCDPAVAAACRAQERDHFQATAAGVFCPLGEGEVDFPGLITAMQERGYTGWAIVEQDILTDDMDAPKRYAQANRDYLRGLGL